MGRKYFGILWLVLVVLSGSVAHADEAAAERRAVALARNIASPFCPGRSLDACPSPRAAQWRRDIHAWTAAGASDQQVRSRLQSRVPGFDLDAHPLGAKGWLLPAGAAGIATLVLLAALPRLLRRRRDATPEPSGADGASRDDLDERLDQELKRLDAW